MDVKNAFLNDDLLEEVYKHPPLTILIVIIKYVAIIVLFMASNRLISFGLLS